MAGYGEDEAFEAWLEANGIDLPSDAPEPAVLRERGSAYVDGLYGPRARGVPTGGYAQSRAWPRTGATAYGSAIPDDVIPVAWIEASYQAAAYEGANPGGLAAVSTGQAVRRVREKVGSLETETEYFEGGDAEVSGATVLSAVEGLVAPFIAPLSAPSFGIWSIGGRQA